MTKLREFEQLVTWDKAMQIIGHSLAIAGDDFTYIYGPVWPERLKVIELAALQAMGNKNKFNAWMRRIKRRRGNGAQCAPVSTWHKGPLRTPLLPSGLAVRKTSCRTSKGSREFLTVSAPDFAYFLKQVGRQPSECIRDWFDAFGVEYISPDETDKTVVKMALVNKNKSKIKRQSGE